MQAHNKSLGTQLLTQGGGPPSVVSQLFPSSDANTRPIVSSVPQPTNVYQILPAFGLGQGLLRKAGAAFAFGEQLGSSTPALATDRIIHAIDGLRKAQDEDKTGTKGQVSSIKDGEKLDVFLAWGCGQLSVELCKGVYMEKSCFIVSRELVSTPNTS